MERRPQLFRPRINKLARVTIFVGALIAVELLLIMIVFFRSNFWRQVNIAIEQPVAFSHYAHAGVVGTDCRYCHTSVDQSHFANIPPTETCVTCHTQVKRDSPRVQPIWQSWETGEPILWQRVHDLPDFVYFNHNVHVNNGVGCTECHGQVNEMEVVWKTEGLFMGWCLDCHRNPEQYLRPAEEVYNMDWQRPDDQLVLGQQLLKEYDINVSRLSNCYICHR